MAGSAAGEVREARAVARYVRVTPRKLRAVVDLVRGKPVAQALELLPFVPRRGARAVAKVIRSAAANAVHNHQMEEERLYIAEARVDEGPRWKRYQPRARGQAYPILKRTSHITVVLRERKGG